MQRQKVFPLISPADMSAYFLFVKSYER